MSPRHTRWALLAGLALAAGWVGVETWAALERPAKSGFLASSPCGGPPRGVEVPALLEGREHPGCVEYTSFYAARQVDRLQLMLDTRGEAQAWIDGESVVFVREGARRRQAFGERRLSPGAHHVRVRVTRADPRGFLRFYALDTREPHAWGMAPTRAEDWFQTAEAAERSIRAGDPSRGPVDALRAALAWALLMGLFVALLIARGTLRRPHTHDLVFSAAAMGVAAAVRVPYAFFNEVLLDEHAYARAASHYLQNLRLGDFASYSWRFNFEHPPMAKWALAVGELYGGFAGSRLVAASVSVATVGLVYGIGRRLLERRDAALAGALLYALLPRVVGLGRIVALGDFVALYWCVALLAMLVYRDRSKPQRAASHDARLLLVAGAAFTVGTFSRATCFWVLLPAIVVWLDASQQRGWSSAAPSVGLAAIGVLGALIVTFVGWPFLWPDPPYQLSRSITHFDRFYPLEYFRGRIARPPGVEYFALALLAGTSLPVLGAALAGLLELARRKRLWDLAVLSVALLAPLAQSFVHIRTGGTRYVATAYVAIAIAAGFAASQAGRWLVRLARDRRSAPLVLALPAALLIAHEAHTLAGVEPYPLSYFNRAVGGAAGVAEARLFELSPWTQGLAAGVAAINEVAPRGATVRYEEAWANTPRLRDDLRLVREGGDIVYVHADHYLSRDLPPGPGCVTARWVRWQGVPIGRVDRCLPGARRVRRGRVRRTRR